MTSPTVPEPLRVLARELVRDGIQRTHPLHRHQERLVLREAARTQRGHLPPEVILQLLYVHRPYSLPAAKVAAPLLDLFLERLARAEFFGGFSQGMAALTALPAPE